MTAKNIVMAAAGASTGSVLGVEDVFSTYLYTGNGSSQNINNGIALGDDTVQVSLVGKTVTNLGGAFHPSYPMSYINDGVLETTNGSNLAYVPAPNYLDVYVDLGSASIVTTYFVAPQGTRDSGIYNLPTDFIVKASNDASTWTTVATFSNISQNFPSDWNPGTFRQFTFSNSTAYRYWRLQNTSIGSASAGVSISEWAVGVTTVGVGKGGMVWIKSRSNAIVNALYDTNRGAGYHLVSSWTDGQAYFATELNAFNVNGFGVGSDSYVNQNNATYASWTFRKQPKFFDVVTWTGNGTNNRQISHALGSAPGCIIVNELNQTGSWYVYHRSNGTGAYMRLNAVDAVTTAAAYFPAVSSTTFTPTSDTQLNTSSVTYVAYLFAHDAGGFGTAGTDNVISCGSYTGNGSGSQSVNLGWEPQWILVKSITPGATYNEWWLFDSMRNWPVDASAQKAFLKPNASAAENTTSGMVAPSATGFNIVGGSDLGQSGITFIYIAIRRGPMKTPTSGTSVFTPVARTGTSATASITSVGFPPDAWWISRRSGSVTVDQTRVDRLRGDGIILDQKTNPESSTTPAQLNITNSMSGVSVGSGSTWNDSSNTYINWFFRRAPGFMDVVCYTGTGSARTVNHNLGVVPELIIVKRRDAITNWMVYQTSATNTNDKHLRLNLTDPVTQIAGFEYWGTPSTATPNMTATTFGLGTRTEGNASGGTYVAYLFASCPGVSKVGSFTQVAGVDTAVNCGFTSGARFILIKSTATTSNDDWYVWDSARGITSGTDPYLRLNSSNAEVTSSNAIVPNASGFTTSGSWWSAGTYIFLAIA